MSFHVMSLVWAKPKLHPTRKLVLLALADYANDDGGSIFPSMNTIARRSCVSVCQARRIVHSFIAEGLLVVGDNYLGRLTTTILTGQGAVAGCAA